MNIHVPNSYEELLAAHDEMIRLISAVTVLNGSEEEIARNEARIRASVPPGLYEHFKSTPENQKLYAVFGVGIEVDLSAYSAKVCYKALYLPHLAKWTYRPLTGKDNGFLMPIKKGENRDRPEYEGLRFKLIANLSEAELAKRVEDAVATFSKKSTVS